MAVAVLFTTSCAKEDISSSIVGNGETVEVTLQQTFQSSAPVLTVTERTQTLFLLMFTKLAEAPSSATSLLMRVTQFQTIRQR